MIKSDWKLINFKAKLSRLLRSITDPISNIDMDIMDIRREDNLWQGLAAILLCLILVMACGCQSQSKVASQDEAKGLVMLEINKQLEVKGKDIEPATNTSSIDPNIDEKLDPALKKKLVELTAEDRLDEEIGMIGKYAGVEPQELRQKVSDLGCSVGTVTASLFTVECQAGDVFEIAKFEFVTYLELEKEVYPLSQNNPEGGGKCGK